MIRDLLVRNWQLKVLALLLALVLWIILIPEEKTFAEKNLSLNLELVNIPPEVEILEPPDTTLNLKVRARKRIINELRPEDFSARLDLSRASIYQQEYLIDTSMIKTPSDVEIVNFSPAYVHIKLERTKKMEMEVVPTIIGRLPEGYRLEKVEVTPTRVMVAGPESKIRARDKVITSPIDASTLTASVVLEVDLILPRPELRLLTPYPRARVNLVIEKKGSGSSAQGGGKQSARSTAPVRN
ncbi:MAG: YbbR-like domain-containing protein [Candidatus Aminicenantes bacterium]|nr:YbbR-like domain-containing protein [Candidatus Aminicenantes bacterium]